MSPELNQFKQKLLIMKSIYLYVSFCIMTLSSLNAQSAQDLYKEGNELLKNKQPEQALTKYNKALEADSNFTFAYMNRAKAYMELKKWDSGVKDFNKVLEKDPKNTDALIGSGRCKYELTYFEGSILDYTKAMELNSKLTSAYYHRGLSLYQVSRYKESLDD